MSVPLRLPAKVGPREYAIQRPWLCQLIDRNAPQRKSKAVKRSLADIELRRLGKGRYLLPLLDPVRDGLPFAMALELQAERGGGTLPASWGDTKAERRLFSLRYILDSTSQVELHNPESLELRPGDSVLLEHSPGAVTVEEVGAAATSADSTSEGWHLASLTLLLPDVIEHHDAGVVKLDASAAEEASRHWRGAPRAGRLAPQAVTSLMAGARERARAAFPRTDESDSAPARRSMHSDFAAPSPAVVPEGHPKQMVQGRDVTRGATNLPAWVSRLLLRGAPRGLSSRTASSRSTGSTKEEPAALNAHHAAPCTNPALGSREVYGTCETLAGPGQTTHQGLHIPVMTEEDASNSCFHESQVHLDPLELRLSESHEASCSKPVPAGSGEDRAGSLSNVHGSWDLCDETEAPIHWQSVAHLLSSDGTLSSSRPESPGPRGLARRTGGAQSDTEGTGAVREAARIWQDAGGRDVGTRTVQEEARGGRVSERAGVLLASGGEERLDALQGLLRLPQQAMLAIPNLLPSLLSWEQLSGRFKKLSSFLPSCPRAVAQRRALHDLPAFQLPKQSNRLALVFDPLSDDLHFTFGVEIFEAGHQTPPHTHPTAHEMFFILAGEGEAFCDGETMAVAPGDVVVFPPHSVHGINNSPSHGKMYCLEMMTTDDMFADLVRSGKPLGVLPAEDLCVLAAVGCG